MRFNYVSQLIRVDLWTPNSAGAVMSELTWVPLHCTVASSCQNEPERRNGQQLLKRKLAFIILNVLLIIMSKIRSALLSILI